MAGIDLRGPSGNAASTALGLGKPAIDPWLRIPAAQRRIICLGDSHWDESTGAGGAAATYVQLRNIEVLPGRPLEGMTGDTTHIINGGNNGVSLNGWLTGAFGTYKYTDLQASYAAAKAAGGPPLLVVTWLNNDFRVAVDRLDPTTGTVYAQGVADFTTFLSNCHTDMPDMPIIIVTPPGATTDNFSSLNYVTAFSGTVNPAGGAQAFTDAVRNAAWAMKAKFPTVEVWDQQTEMFGRKSVATTDTNMMANQIHQSTDAYKRRGVGLAKFIQKIAGLATSGAVGYAYPALGSSESRTGGTVDGLAAITQTPWTVDPRALEDTSRFTELGSGYNGNGATLATGSQAIIFGPRPRDLAPYDILQISAAGVTEAIQITTTPTVSASGGPVDNLQVTVTIPASLNGATNWRVRVFRDRTGGNATFAALLDALQHAYGNVVPLRSTGGGNGFADFNMYPGTVDAAGSSAANVNPSTDKLLFADGTSFTLATANGGGLAGLRYNNPNLRVAISGTDFTSKAGQLAVVYGNHLPATWKARVLVAVDPPSIAAGAVGTVDVSVGNLNARNSNDGSSVNATGALDQFPVRAIPPTGLEAGLVYLGCYPIGTDSVRVVLANNSGGAVDGASKQWAFIAG